jgi:TetR/AcrR family transcriptional regulator, transcriptional repressor for nem operon
MLVANFPYATTRELILNVATDLIRVQGFGATRIDDICQAAGVSKGAFFHHFESKEAMGIAVATHWRNLIERLFENASYHTMSDPAEKLIAYVDFRQAILDRSIAAFTCLVGTMVAETYASHPTIRAACADTIDDHALSLVETIEAAMLEHKVTGHSAHSLAMFIHGTLQGAFVLAKAHGDASLAHACLDHLRAYLAGLFNQRPVGLSLQRNGAAS